MRTKLPTRVKPLPLPVVHQTPQVGGRGAQSNPHNRFERLSFECDPEDSEGIDRPRRTQVFRDSSKSILSFNTSPDVPFDVGLNPYRGCEHGCIYCYARPTHEYLGFSAGVDFESKIVIKENAGELLRAKLSSPRWKPRPIMMSGVTDPYQPMEKRLRLTRDCLVVLAECLNPVGIITKNYLVTRDIDLLAQMAEHNAVSVALSITSLERRLQQRMEPRTSTPKRRIEAVRELSQAGIPVHINIGPVIPGLTDHEIPAILEQAAEAGAQSASFIMLRLPTGVDQLFVEWLTKYFPDRAEKVLSRLRSVRSGELNQAGFGQRMRGDGPFSDQVRRLFRITRDRVGLTKAEVDTLSSTSFRRPSRHGQLDLF